MDQDRTLGLVGPLAPVRDAEIAHLSGTDGARELFDGIVAQPELVESPSPAMGVWRRVRASRFAVRAVAGATAAALGLAAVLASSVFVPGPAAASIKFAVRGEYIVARVTDPEADVGELAAAFEARGLDVELELVPVSPSAVGTVTAVGGSGIEGIETLAGSCTSPGGGCPIGLRIPVDFRGHAEIQLGRNAEPGERYVSAGDAFAPGEALHCTDLLGAPVERAAAVLRARDLQPTWHRDDRNNATLGPGAVTGYVVAATAVSRREVVVWVDGHRPGRAVIEPGGEGREC